MRATACFHHHVFSGRLLGHKRLSLQLFATKLLALHVCSWLTENVEDVGSCRDVVWGTMLHLVGPWDILYFPHGFSRGPYIRISSHGVEANPVQRNHENEAYFTCRGSWGQRFLHHLAHSVHTQHSAFQA